MNEAALLRLAGRQHGLVTSVQLAGLGFSRSAVARRVDAGVLFRVHRGVYAVAGTRDTFEFRVMAAVLASGDRALASGQCAAAVYGLRRIRCDAPEITVSGRAAPNLPGVDRMRDEARDEKCAQLGWTVRRYSTDDIRLRPAGIADEVERLRRRAEAA